MITRVKFANRFKTFLSDGYGFIGELIASQFGSIALSKLNHNLALLFFKNQIGNKLFTDIKQPIASGIPGVNISFELPTRCCSALSRCGTTEYRINPLVESYVGVINFEQSPIMNRPIAIPILFGDQSYVKTTLSINDSSHIGKINFLINGWNIIQGSFVVFSSYFFHSIGLYIKQYYYLIVYELKLLVQAERLSEKTPYGDAIV